MGQASRPIAPLHSSVRNRTAHNPRQLRRYSIGAVLVIVTGLLAVKLLHHQPDLDNVKVVETRVAKLYVLPTNETPALATVTNSAKVQSSFAGKVKNNDKILIYQQNHKAIVYRPSLQRIVDVEPVSIDTPPSASAGQ